METRHNWDLSLDEIKSKSIHKNNYTLFSKMYKLCVNKFVIMGDNENLLCLSE